MKFYESPKRSQNEIFCDILMTCETPKIITKIQRHTNINGRAAYKYLQKLIDKKLISVENITSSNAKRPRYIYTTTEKGRKIANKYKSVKSDLKVLT
jgi:predicted transcriptional regulator